MKQGKVYLIGAGPGDPGLITVKGLRCLREADVVIYDRLAAPSLLKEAKESAEKIYVGKDSARHTLEQSEIDRLIVAKAKEGKVVARLKGGDPFVFGRGGEEALFLKENGIPFEVVPGVTAAIAAAAYAGIPVTHRGLSASFALVTGHEDPTKPESDIDWPSLAGIGTLAFYMGVKNLPHIVEKLVAHGRPESTPVAVIQWGTTSRQRTVVGVLGDIVKLAKDLDPPALTLVGEVVGLREQLNWFETRPLFGKTILVTRAREQASEFARQLEDLGAHVIEMPTIRITAPDDYAPLDQALRDLPTFNWAVFTSANGVDYFLRRLLSRGGDVRDLKGLKLAAIGPATADKLKAYYLSADCQPATHTAEGLLEALTKTGRLKGQRFLIPRAAEARDVLPNGLREAGAEVVEVHAYKTVMADPPDADVLARLRQGQVDFVTFASSSTVRNFVTLVGANLPKHVRYASIGPITTQTAKDLGIEISVEAKEITIPGLVRAIVEAVH